MRAGRLIRDERRDAAAAAKACTGCGHPTGGHFESPYSTLEIVDGALVETRNPDHRAGAFHCSVDGCPCVVDLAAAR